ncbi:hypothetical protein [Stappia sp. ES.058]|uniref:hypothetical protein n=1 Tax=Stappia sp. ES.058 TaxID=1881061 RepID=UPI00087D0E8E|nr:hypothetical protein [Stappia sp. ES.058]SDT91582.1 hypothetical protein SAMN05428979_0365 [Stappia sp. ES.058]
MSIERAIVMLCGVAAAAVAAGSPASAADDRFVCWDPSPAQLAADVEYWTPDRRAAAVPETFGLTTPPGADALAAPMVASSKADVAVAPYSYGGKLFYSRGGNDYSASAQFLSKDNTVLAAAHSMYKGGNQATNITFYRAYDGGGGTKFDIENAAVLAGWPGIADDAPSPQKSALDYAILKTSANSDAGKFALGKDADFVDVTLIGYPVAKEDGAHMYKQPSQRIATIGDAFQAEPNDLTQGASGGAWFIGAAAPYTAVSSISSGSGGKVYGPVFKDLTQDLVDYVAAGCQ